MNVSASGRLVPEGMPEVSSERGGTLRSPVAVAAGAETDTGAAEVAAEADAVPLTGAALLTALLTLLLVAAALATSRAAWTRR